MSTLKDAETGQRGFLLTGNESYLKPVLAARATAVAQLTNLADALGNDGDQRQGLDRLGALIQRKCAELAETIRLQQAGNSTAALAIVNSDPGRKVMDEMRVLVRSMQAGESKRLESIDRAAKDGGVYALVAMTFGAALMCLLTAVNVIVISQDLSGRARAEQALRTAQHELENRVEERTAELVAANGEIRTLNTDLEERVRQRTAELEVSNRELEAFSYSVSHDLRAPLRAIEGFSQALEDDCADRLDERGHDYLGRVRKATMRMAELIDALLTLARVTRAQVNHERIDLADMARAIADDLAEREPQRHVEFAIVEKAEIDGDGNLLRVALDNLLANAWKFTGKQELGHIEFGAIASGPRPTFYVRDDGAGFDMTYVDRLFGAFQRLHGNDDFAGTGIGLATVQRIVHRHGGRVWAEGKLGEGATFYFSI